MRKGILTSCSFNALIVLLVARGAAAASGPSQFVALPNTAGDTFSAAFAISDDGQTIVGQSHNNTRFHAIRWTDGVPDIPPDLHGNVAGDASGISAHGEAIVGGSAAMFRWTAGSGWQNLGYFGVSGYGGAYGVSADGNVVVGFLGSPPGRSGFEAALWSPGTGLVDLGRLPGSTDSEADAVSDDGRVVVGGSEDSGGRSFIWTADTGIRPLSGLPAAATSRALAISGDGKVVVGGLFGIGAYRWKDGAVDLLGEGQATAVSDDGNIVVGDNLTSGGFIWTATSGRQGFDSYLRDLGIYPAGWTNLSPYAMTPDGSVLAGAGQNPDGNSQAFYVVIPEPSGGALIFLFAALLLRPARRSE